MQSTSQSDFKKVYTQLVSSFVLYCNKHYIGNFQEARTMVPESEFIEFLRRMHDDTLARHYSLIEVLVGLNYFKRAIYTSQSNVQGETGNKTICFIRPTTIGLELLASTT